MSFIVLIIVGAIVGYLATLIVPPKQPKAWYWDVLIGIVGALLGKFLFYDVLGIGSAGTTGTLTLAGIIWGILGSVVLIGILRLLKAY